MPPLSSSAGRLLVLTTGGTIGAQPYPDPRNPPVDCVMPSGRDLVREWLEGEKVPCQVQTLAHVDSKLIDAAYRQRLLSSIVTSPCLAAIVSHGTDTITATADFLAERAPGELAGKCVVLVGAMTPLSNGPGSDGHANLLLALEIARGGVPGVSIALSDWDERGKWVPRHYVHRPGRWRKHYDADGRHCRLVPARS